MFSLLFLLFLLQFHISTCVLHALEAVHTRQCQTCSGISRQRIAPYSKRSIRIRSSSISLKAAFQRIPDENDSLSIPNNFFDSRSISSQSTDDLFTNSRMRSLHPTKLGSLAGQFLESSGKGALNSFAPESLVTRRLDAIEKPKIDARSYRYIWLSNGMQALLASDPEADVASAALNIHVGHFQDPESFPGLAHFHEHMLFLGTEEYPIEGEYEEYLNKNGGFSNAFTSMEDTNFYFEVDSSALKGALKRFSSFFKSPLFKESATDRELNAVDSENTNNLQEDTWRLFQLQKSLSNRGHPFHKFSTGNLRTLKKDGLREALLHFHHMYYSGPLMKLAVIGREDIDTLEQWVEGLFGSIRNSGAPTKHVYAAPAFGAEQLGRRVLSVPIKETRKVSLAFPVPLTDTRETGLYAKPAAYIGHLIGHEGPGSLHAFLNQRGWINGLSSGTQVRTDDFGLFKIVLSLTVAGMENLEEVIDSIFEFLAMMKRQGPQKWIFDELMQMSKVSFAYKEWGGGSGFTSKRTESMAFYPPEHVLSGVFRMDDWRPDLIQKFEDLLTPDNCQIFVTSSTFRPEETVEWDREEWYGTQHKVIPFSKQEISRWSESTGKHPDLRLPGPNEFIPTDFSLKCEHPEIVPTLPKLTPEEARDTPPTLVRSEFHSGEFDGYRVWHKLDTVYKVPRATLLMKIGCGRDGNYASPLHMSMARLFARMVREELQEYAYDASLAGLRYGVNAEPDGLHITVSGYSDKLAILAKRVGHSVRRVIDYCGSLNSEAEKAMEIKTLALFNKHKQGLLKEYANFEKEQPYQLAMYYTRMLLEAGVWHISEYAKVVNSSLATPSTMSRVMEAVLSRAQVDVLLHGNLAQAEALELADMVHDIILPPGQVLPLTDAELQEWRRTVLPEGQEVKLEMEMPNPNEENSATEVYFQVGTFEQGDYKKDCLLDLLNHFAYNSAFKALRTEEQLGYIVSTLIRKSGWPARVGGFSVIVQSPQHTPQFLDDRIEAWLVRFMQELEAMSVEEFARNLQGLMSQKLEKCTRMGEETSNLWAEIIAKDETDFFRAQKEAQILSLLQKEELLDFLSRYMLPGTEKRRKLSVQMWSSRLQNQRSPAEPNNDKTMNTIVLSELHSIRKFKRSAHIF